MIVTRSRFLLIAASAAVVIGLPLAGRLSRRASGAHCALDGMRIEPGYRARVVDRSGQSFDFCCVSCAQRWLERTGAVPATVFVTDETTGAEIDARTANFVRSSVVTGAVTRNRIHVFAGRADAEDHARAFGGILLAGPERPLVAQPGSATDHEKE